MRHLFVGLKDLFLTLSPEHFAEVIKMLEGMKKSEWSELLEAFERAKGDDGYRIRMATPLYRLMRMYWGDIGRYDDCGYYWRVLPPVLPTDSAESYRERHDALLSPLFMLFTEVLSDLGWRF